MQELQCKLNTYLRQSLAGRKCILIVGAIGSGKSTFIKLLSGYTFESSQNQDGQLTLTQASIPDTQILQPFKYTNESLDFELRLFVHEDQKVVFIDMPSFPMEYRQSFSNEKNSEQFIFCSLVWSYVTSISEQISICLMIPIDKVINDDDQQLIKFILAWQASVFNGSKQQIQQCVNIVLSKVTYKEQDTQELIKYLTSIIENGKVDSTNNTLNELIEGGRIYCFFNQESEDNDVSLLKDQLFQKIQYFNPNTNQLFSEDFMETAFYSKMSGCGVQLLNQIEKHFDLNNQKVVNKINQTLHHASNLISLLSVSKLAASFSFPESFLHKQKEFIQKFDCSKQLKIVFAEMNGFSEVVSSQQGWANYILQFNDLVNKLNAQKIGIVNFVDFTKRILEYLFSALNLSQESKNNFKHFIESYLYFCFMIDTVANKFESDGEEIEAQSKLKKFSYENKKKLSSGIRSSISIFVQSLHLQKSITQQTPFLKKLKEVSSQDFDGQSEESDRQEDLNAGSSRWYYSPQQTQNPYNSLIERVKKVSLPKQNQTDLKQKSLLRDLFFDIDTNKETRKQSIKKLAEKFLSFGCCEEALFVFMKLEDPFLLYQNITKNIFMLSMVSYKFLTLTLIPYLEERCVLYSNYLEAEEFLHSLHFCYDYLAENNVSSPDEYESLMKLCNQIRFPCKQEEMLIENRIDQIQKSNTYDIKLLTRSQLAKGEIISLLEAKQKWLISNRILYAQIQQILA